MEQKINIAELLKDCPEGMELDCTMYDGCTFNRLVEYEHLYPIKVQTPDGQISLNKYGCYSCSEHAKCIIFPKGKTTWEGFQRPFVAGDVIYTDKFVAILSNITERGSVWYHCYYCIDTEMFKAKRDFGIGNINCDEFRFATEEEKAKLFQAIKSNGYKWNAETKTLEKLEDIEDKGNISDGYHTFNELYEYRLLYNASMFNELARQGLYDVHKSKKHSDGTIPFGDDNWFIVQAELPTGQISNHYEMKDWGLFNVPEKEKANPYDGHTPQDVAKRLRDFLTLGKLIEPRFKVGDKVVKKGGIGVPVLITSVGDEYYYSNTGNSVGFFKIKEQDNWELVLDKFDITTLVPFESRVLTRDNNLQKWFPAMWGYYDFDSHDYPYKLIGGGAARYCIPFESNEHLLGTTNDCDEYYKVW